MLDNRSDSQRPTKRPAECADLDDVRIELDRIDRALVTLFAERHHYVHRVAELKEDEGEAFDPARIEVVISKVRERAREKRLDPDQAELIWRTLINWNINYEKGIIAARHPEA